LFVLSPNATIGHPELGKDLISTIIVNLTTATTAFIGGDKEIGGVVQRSLRKWRNSWM
jgi:hypothetical protein